MANLGSILKYFSFQESEKSKKMYKIQIMLLLVAKKLQKYCFIEYAVYHLRSYPILFSMIYQTRKKPGTRFWPLFKPEKPVLKSRPEMETLISALFLASSNFSPLNDYKLHIRPLALIPMSFFFFEATFHVRRCYVIFLSTYCYGPNNLTVPNNRKAWHFLLISIL